MRDNKDIMKISLNWIKDFVDIPAKYSAKELAELLTLRTCEVEGYEDQKVKFSNMVVGKVVKLHAHSNADKLRLADTDIGGRIVQIVCGGQNLEEGMTVPVALPGAVVNWHGAGEVAELKETKIRGERSFGMICAGEEIGLEPSPPGFITDLGALFAKLGIDSKKPGTPLAEALGLDDVIFEIDNKSLTHRPDLWGHYGMAREFAAFLGKKLKSFAPKISFPKNGPRVKVDLAKTDIARRFLTGIVTGIRIGESPQWMQKRLLAVGLRPVNSIVDITNYVMIELGYPMHAFDRKVVADDHFVIRFAHHGEKITTIDHKIRQLALDDAVVADSEHALAIAGIMGGVDSEINARTNEIILEVGNWNHVLIRRTSQHYGLRSDAAQRFEKSLDPEIGRLAFLRAFELIMQICSGARPAGPMTDEFPQKPNPVSVLLNAEKVVRKIGSDISEKDMASYLQSLEFGVTKAKRGVLKVAVPSFRATKDINIEDDLIEEIARMYGYEKINPVLPSLPIKLPIENHERELEHCVREILSLSLGFSELSQYSFYGKSEISKCMLPEEAHIRLSNPLTEDQTHMRISLLPNMLKAAAVNLNSRENFKIYEIGRTYIKNKKFFPLEEKFICGIIVRPGDTKEIFYDALGALEHFLKKLNVKYRVEQSQNPPPYAHPSKCADVKIDGYEITMVYEIHPQVLKNFGIEEPVAAFELNFSRMAAVGMRQPEYHPLPRFPVIEIDISVLVPKKTAAREVLELIRHTEQNLISDISLIDIFEDANLGADKKSFTFRVLLQSPDRTLTDEEMKQVQQRIFKVLKNAKFEIRGL